MKFFKKFFAYVAAASISSPVAAESDHYWMDSPWVVDNYVSGSCTLMMTRQDRYGLSSISIRPDVISKTIGVYITSNTVDDLLEAGSTRMTLMMLDGNSTVFNDTQVFAYRVATGGLGYIFGKEFRGQEYEPLLRAFKKAIKLGLKSEGSGKVVQAFSMDGSARAINKLLECANLGP